MRGHARGIAALGVLVLAACGGAGVTEPAPEGVRCGDGCAIRRNPATITGHSRGGEPVALASGVGEEVPGRER